MTLANPPFYTEDSASHLQVLGNHITINITINIPITAIIIVIVIFILIITQSLQRPHHALRGFSASTGQASGNSHITYQHHDIKNSRSY